MPDPSEPSLRILATNPACSGARNVVPLATPQSVAAQRMNPGSIAEGLDYISVVVTGLDPSFSSSSLAPGAQVVISQVGQGEGRGRGFFVSTNEETSDGISFNGADAIGRFYCIAPGNVVLEASMENYQPGGTGSPRTVTTTRPYTLRCLTRTQFAEECTLQVPEGDAALEMGVDAGPADVGPDVLEPDARPTEWNIRFSEPAEQGEDLEINIRNSGGIRPESIELIFQMEDSGAPREAEVEFSFFGQALSGARLEPSRVTTTGGGVAKVTVYSGQTSGVIVVRASAHYKGETKTARSPTINVRGAVPSANRFTLTCGDEIVPAFRIREDADHWLLSDLRQTTCRAHLGDRAGGQVDINTQVFFATEAGNITQGSGTDELGLAFADHWSANPPPISHAAPMRVEQDGVVRIIAITRGEEDYEDLDGDNQYGPNDSFDPDVHDLGEPYIDANDNNEYDPGEFYRDSNEDGVYTEGNGVWDPLIEIWTSTYVLWTGRLNWDKSETGLVCDVSSPPGSCSTGDAGCTVTIVRGAGAVLRASGLFRDDNGNCLGGLASDTVSLTAGGDLRLVAGMPELSIRDFCFQSRIQPTPEAQPMEWLLMDFSQPPPPRMDGEEPAAPSLEPLTINLTYKLSNQEQEVVDFVYSVCSVDP